MISPFENVLNKTPNKVALFEDELRNIEYFLISLESAEKLYYYYVFDKVKPAFEFEYKYYAEDFLKEYKAILKDKKIDKERYKPNDWISKEHIYCTVVDFYNYVKDLKTLQEEYSRTSKSNNSTLTIKQKLLALHYLGLNMGVTDNVNTAKLLSQILGAGHENIRKALSYLSNGKNEVRTESNLKIIANLFEAHSLTDISKRIKEEIK